jgi:hypothetical protein
VVVSARSISLLCLARCDADLCVQSVFEDAHRSLGDHPSATLDPLE